MTRPADFSQTVRRGRRVGTPSVVLHFMPVGTSGIATEPACVGFIVSKSVGGAVVRNRVKRQLRHLMSSRMQRLPAGSALVVRALTAAAGRASAELAMDLDGALSRLRLAAP